METGNFQELALDDVDRQILGWLQEDARLNVKEIADRLGMTKTPVYDRIKRLERNGVIGKYVALLNTKKVQPSITVFCSVTLDRQKADHLDEFVQEVKKIPEVVECYLMGGLFDYLLKVVVTDLEAYHQFSSYQLAVLPHVAKIQSSFVLKEQKFSTGFPPLIQKERPEGK